MCIVPNTQLPFSDELSHHGILGMKWGIRRFQPYKKGEKKGKEVDEAAKKKSKAKKIAVGVGISAAVAAGAAVTIATLKAGKEYKNWDRLFGPNSPIRPRSTIKDPIIKRQYDAFGDEWYYARGLKERVKKNPMFKVFLSELDKDLIKSIS